MTPEEAKNRLKQNKCPNCGCEWFSLNDGNIEALSTVIIWCNECDAAVTFYMKQEISEIRIMLDEEETRLSGDEEWSTELIDGLYL